MKHRHWTIALCVALWLLPLTAQAQRLVEWTEDAGELELGYPVPIPVDTPLPFDGFRTYDGLNMRHQDLAASTGLAHGTVIGQTVLGRDIWAYQLGDQDDYTLDGLPESGMLINGGIHAREWQSPEVSTGIIELLTAQGEDNAFYRYLLDNVNPVVIPVLNVDGFLQTQRYPTQNYLDSDPSFPQTSPRDGRMRRKNLLNADENLFTIGDHLNGVDMNRNNPPFWNSRGNPNNTLPASLVYAGPAPHSEPETQAMADAVDLIGADHLRMFTDIHSFGQVHFAVETANISRNSLQNRLLTTLVDHHRSFPAGKRYVIDRSNGPGGGLGLTSEFFAQTYQVPSWTLEVEPSGAFHPSLPGAGRDYGSPANVNGHSGFILPESEVRRVREQLAETFAVGFYQQAGPPALMEVKVLEADTQAIIFDSSWDPDWFGVEAFDSDSSRRLHRIENQPLTPGRDYILWLAFDKPMRWREDGALTPLPGQPDNVTDFSLQLLAGDQPVAAEISDPVWLDSPGGAPLGYRHYRDDAVAISLRLTDNPDNQTLLADGVLQLQVSIQDMVGQALDADPATPVSWDGGWAGYENTGGSNSLNGGDDLNHVLPAADTMAEESFQVVSGTSAAWFDPKNSGEGFLIEVLADQRAVLYWFTYDEAGDQRWFTAVGEVRGNRLLFPELLVTRGGRFGPDFDPDEVEISVAGSASFLWTSCDRGEMRYRLGDRHGRQDLFRLSTVMGIDCDGQTQATAAARQSGSWYDFSHAGEGYAVEILDDGRSLVYWFTYDADGNQRWLVGTGTVEGQTLNFAELLTTRGGLFGPDFDPDTVERLPWGSLQLELNCTTGSASYQSSEAGFGSGSLNLSRLSRLAGLDCET